MDQRAALVTSATGTRIYPVVMQALTEWLRFPLERAQRLLFT